MNFSAIPLSLSEKQKNETMFRIVFVALHNKSRIKMKKIVIIMLISLILPAACNTGRKTNAEKTSTADDGIDSTFQYKVDRFADIEILRYPVPGFNALSLQQKELIYYLSQAALEGRDILYDQHNKYNLAIRRVLEGVYENYMGDKSTEDWKNLETYLKQIWMATVSYTHLDVYKRQLCR